MVTSDLFLINDQHRQGLEGEEEEEVEMVMVLPVVQQEEACTR